MLRVYKKKTYSLAQLVNVASYTYDDDFEFSLVTINKEKSYYLKKIKYIRTLGFLNKRKSIVGDLSSCLAKNGRVFPWLKLLYTSYIKLLRANFLNLSLKNVSNFLFKADNNLYFWNFIQSSSFYANLNVILLKKALELRAMYRFGAVIYKKRKKVQKELRATRVNSSKRLLVMLRWMKLIFKPVKKIFKSKENFLILFESLVVNPPETNLLFEVKLQTYRIYMLRLV